VALREAVCTPNVDREGDLDPLGIGHGKDGADEGEDVEQTGNSQSIFIDAMLIKVGTLV
jgi:hypothetical protein